METGNVKAGTGRKQAPEAVVSAAVGDRLKSLYDTVAAEPVPDRFADLLNQLAAAESDEKDEDPS